MRITQKVKKILAAYESDNPGTKANIARILMEGKLGGPSFADIAKKHGGKADYLAEKIKSGGSGLWGEIPMPPQTLPQDDTGAIAAWLAGGAGK